MKPVKRDLILCIWHTGQGRINVRRPHVHAHALDPRQLFGGGQSHIPVLQHLFRTPDPHIQDLPRRFIRHHRDVFVPLAKRGLIHTDMRNNLRFPVLKSTLYRTVHDTENFLNF